MRGRNCMLEMGTRGSHVQGARGLPLDSLLASAQSSLSLKFQHTLKGHGPFTSVYLFLPSARILGGGAAGLEVPGGLGAKASERWTAHSSFQRWIQTSESNTANPSPLLDPEAPSALNCLRRKTTIQNPRIWILCGLGQVSYPS